MSNVTFMKGEFVGNVYYDNAERLGQSAAEWMSSGKLPFTPEQVLERVGQFRVKVTIVPLFSKLANSKVRAIYDHSQRLIVVQEASLLSLQEACETAGLGPVGRTDVLAMHIAHELFHHLEETGEVSMSAYYQFSKEHGQSKFMDVFSLHRVISRFFKSPSLIILREVAAHSFVTRLLGLSVSPMWLEQHHAAKPIN
jgi:hypothetical protein